eukprot:scaffold48171_cov27-Tisochrysis_lutea.AAC.1
MPGAGGRGRGRMRNARITGQFLPEIRSRGSVIGEQVAVPGSYWEGRMTAEERNTKYLCTVLAYDPLYKPITRAPGAYWKPQEMGITGTGSLELGDSSGEIFYMSNADFLKHYYYYQTFPDRMPTPAPATAPDPPDSDSPTPTPA